MNEDNLNIHLHDFDGPLELLLHLIKQSKMDIYDIDIKDITDQYVNYLNKMKRMRIEIAGEFFVLAANLMRIKSQMLLAEEIDDDYEEDPREELVTQLVEYKKYKQAAFELKQREKNRNKMHSRNLLINNKNISIETDEFQIGILKNAWNKIKQRQQNNLDLPIERINEWNYDINTQTKIIEKYLRTSSNNELKFSHLFTIDSPIEELITDFLALLTMVKHKIVKVFQQNDDSDITIKGVNK
ncbi:segregation/condensation protein A [Fructilactobacillus lindneri]|uniref:Segregation and condensation protein A n=2 Tax=Fructilactobacillus lindneri TaxID=53444 RepID=A0A0R2JWG8_9LACO|nr:segregation/condensation protein A [Fructilactobacillus lindneri]ANZ58149.1 segregation/condensation protein A [Fructilactobacillus lindneri]ANZ59470.1 segregation/condensation protein A [Fructilactobacillus lindneri]KRN78970.1 segregation and condensation protein A [Fructilactobacillus lindneri DSM 20690 = JCM 11027]POH03019.1 segregation/condensation protein A [Fructilactobacillus lindneri]POH04134.1 segregation/condensation protein A [Fructilactobacillus lindneri]